MKAELPWKASGDFLAYLSGNIVIMCCIDSLACRFASFVRTVGRTEEAMSAAAAAAGRRLVCGDDNDDSAETEHCSMAPGC